MSSRGFALSFGVLGGLVGLAFSALANRGLWAAALLVFLLSASLWALVLRRRAGGPL